METTKTNRVKKTTKRTWALYQKRLTMGFESLELKLESGIDQP